MQYWDSEDEAADDSDNDTDDNAVWNDDYDDYVEEDDSDEKTITRKIINFSRVVPPSRNQNPYADLSITENDREEKHLIFMRAS